jgi:peptidoglycan/LPS O-acetylase OafA/YrhL
MKRIDQLTFTRFAMILLVMFYHDTGSFYTGPIDFFPFSALLRSAPTAVAYLYVLSGFVMSLVYYRPGEKMDKFSYWRARFVRIYPLYIISFLLICIYYYDSLFQIKPQKIIANLFVVQAWIPAYSQSFNYSSWSMTVEFFFYAIFPFLILWAVNQSTRRLIGVALTLWGVSQAVHYTLWLGYFPEYWNFIVYFPLFHLNSFVMGVVGGIWYLRIGREQAVSTKTTLSILAISFLIIAVYTVISTDIFPFLPHNLEPMAGLLTPFMILFIVALALDESRLSQILRHPVLVNLGESSYAIYILHVPTFWLFERALEHYRVPNAERIFDITFLPFMILIGVGMHFYVDTPLRRWLKNFLQTISIRVFLLDLAIAALAVLLVFQFRFDAGREYRSYRDMERLMIWVAFFARPALSLIFGSCRPELIMKPGPQWIRQLVLSVSLSSVVMAASVYWGYSTGWFENFPRSIFALDWLIVITLSLLVRYAFRTLKIYKQESLPA